MYPKLSENFSGLWELSGTHHVKSQRANFPGHLCKTGRKTMLKVLAEEGFESVALAEEDTKFGSVESLADAQQLADLFNAHREEIDGVVITLPNFGCLLYTS